MSSDSLWSDHVPELQIDVEQKTIRGPYINVVRECDRLAKEGWKYSRGGYVKLGENEYERVMYFFY